MYPYYCVAAGGEAATSVYEAFTTSCFSSVGLKAGEVSGLATEFFGRCQTRGYCCAYTAAYASVPRSFVYGCIPLGSMLMYG